MEVERSLTIMANGLPVTVVIDPPRAYVGSSFAPLITVQWTGSVGVCGYQIDFGDGTPMAGGDIPGPPISLRHGYFSAGNYVVSAYIIDYPTGAEGRGSATAQVRSPPSIGFTADKTSGPAPLTVTLTISVTGGFEPYLWTLTYGDTSPVENGSLTAAGTFNMVHTYGKGIFTAKAAVTDALGA